MKKEEELKIDTEPMNLTIIEGIVKSWALGDECLFKEFEPLERFNWCKDCGSILRNIRSFTKRQCFDCDKERRRVYSKEYYRRLIHKEDLNK